MWSSSSTSSAKSWTQTFSSSLRTLGEEEVDEVDGRSIDNSTLNSLNSLNSNSNGMSLSQGQGQGGPLKRSLLPKVQEDSFSVLTYDPHVQTTEELLQQKEDELRELQSVQKVQNDYLEQTRAALTKLQLQHGIKERDWKMTFEEIQSQKIILQERLSVMEDDVHNEDLLQHLTNLISEDAPKELQHSDDDDEDKVRVKSTFRLFGGALQPSMRQTQFNSEHRIHVLEEYIQKLQDKLKEAMHKLTVLSNQISTMEEAHEDQISKVIHKIKESEQERTRIEVLSEERLQTLQHEKRLAEQALLAKLERKSDKLERLEDHVDELCEMASSGKLSQHQFEGATQVTNLKQQFDELSQQKDNLTGKHDQEMEALQQEVRRLRQHNEKLERQLERHMAGDDLTNFDTMSSDDDTQEGETFQPLSNEGGGTPPSPKTTRTKSPVRTSSTSSRAKSHSPSRGGKSHASSTQRNESPTHESSSQATLPTQRRHHSLPAITHFNSSQSSTMHNPNNSDDDEETLDHISAASYDYEDCEKKLHVDQHRPVEKKEFRRLSLQMQQAKWAGMDQQSREKSQSVVNRFL